MLSGVCFWLVLGLDCFAASCGVLLLSFSFVFECFRSSCLRCAEVGFRLGFDFMRLLDFLVQSFGGFGGVLLGFTGVCAFLFRFVLFFLGCLCWYGFCV